MTVHDRIDWSARFELLGVSAEIIALDTPEVEFVSSSELKTTFKGTFYIPPETDIRSRMSTVIRPYLTVNGDEYPCGTYVITGVSDSRSDGQISTELTGYSVLYLAKRTCVEDRLHYAAGTSYLSVVRSLLIASGISEIVTDEESAATLQTDREDWEPGTPYLDIINQLLSECGYADVWPDMLGKVHISRPVSATAASVTHTYSEGQYSIIGDGYKREDDRYGKYNVVRAVCSNPDLKTPMTATSELTDPSIPYSIPNIGRVLHVEQVDNIASQSELQRVADDLIWQQRSITETCEFYTAVDPTHGCRDVTALSRGDLTGVWRETGWRLPMSAAYDMTHTAERVISR